MNLIRAIKWTLLECDNTPRCRTRKPRWPSKKHLCKKTEMFFWWCKIVFCSKSDLQNLLPSPFFSLSLSSIHLLLSLSCLSLLLLLIPVCLYFFSLFPVSMLMRAQFWCSSRTAETIFLFLFFLRNGFKSFFGLDEKLQFRDSILLPLKINLSLPSLFSSNSCHDEIQWFELGAPEKFGYSQWLENWKVWPGTDLASL